MFQKAKTTKKVMALILTLVMVVGLIPGMSLTAYADTEADGGTTTITSDRTDNYIYIYDGTLIINQGVTFTCNNAYFKIKGNGSKVELHGTLTGNVSDSNWASGVINVYLSDGAKYTVTGQNPPNESDLRYYGYDAATDGNGTVSVKNGTTDVTSESMGYKTTAYTYTATPSSGYKFKNWTKGEGGEVLGTDASINVTCGQNGQYQVYANFEDAPAHTHSFTYTASGATITASCGEGCDITKGLTLTISAPTGDLVADGTKTFEATLSTGYNTTAFPEGSISDISYTKDGQPYNGTPTEAGAYVASVTVGDATASVNYTVISALAAAKTAAKGELDTLLAGKNEADYDADDWTALTQAITDGKTAIDNATTTDAVATAKSNAETAVNAIKTTAEKAAEALATAKTTAKGELDTLLAGKNEADYDANDWTALTQAIADGKTAIDNATTTDAVATAKSNAETAVNAIKTKAEKKDAADTAAANGASDTINALPATNAVTTADKDAIEAARAAYNALTADQKAKVSAETLQKLTDAETALAKAQDSSTTSPQTGDNSHMGLWIAIMILSLCALATMLFIGKKKRVFDR